MATHHTGKHTIYLQVAEVNHAIHHLANTEAVTEVVEGVVTVVLLNCQLEQHNIICSLHRLQTIRSNIFPTLTLCQTLLFVTGMLLFATPLRVWYKCIRACSFLYVYQPAFERDGVHIEFFHQSQVMVHVLQTAQHLQQK